jgi:SagB-type dehydrogenase family enzyme
MKTAHRPVLALLIGVLALMPTLSPAAGETVQLPKPSFTGKMPVEAAMVRKKSVRNFKGAPMTPADVSQILWAANGNLPVDAVSGATTKVLPSAGGLYALDVFLVAGKGSVKDLPEGVYQYNPANNTLLNIADGDNRALLASACLSQMWMARAPVMLVIGGVFSRMTAKYGDQGIKYVYMEAGNSNQNAYLQAESLGFGLATVGAFQAAPVASAIKLPTGVTPLLVMPVGR